MSGDEVVYFLKQPHRPSGVADKRWCYRAELFKKAARMLTACTVLLHGPETSWPMPAYPSASERYEFFRVDQQTPARKKFRDWH